MLPRRTPGRQTVSLAFACAASRIPGSDHPTSRTMSSAAPTKRLYPANTLPYRKGVIDWLKPFVTASVGMKATTAITGLLLTGFVIVHLIGNLKLFAGREAINGYAKFLKDLGPLLWIARGGLLTVFVVHIY